MTEREEATGRARLSSIRKRRRRARLLRWLVFLAAIGFAVFLWLRYASVVFPPALDRSGELAEAPQEIPLEPAVPPAEERPAPPPESAPGEAAAPAAPLPTLATSDAVLRREAAGLSDARAWRRGLASRDLLERFVLAVVQVSEGTSPRKPLVRLVPSARFRVQTAGGGRITTDPASYTRYDEVARVIAALDAQACAALYRRFEPLVDEVHAGLGAPDTPLRDVLGRAAAELLVAPRVIGEPELVFHVNHYRYADPNLERLSGAQKLVLRTGPANARRIQDKLREIALALGVPERDLPETPVHRVGAP